MVNGAVTASYRCAFMTFEAVERGLERKFLLGHGFSYTDWHRISQQAKARDWWAPLLELIQLAHHFLLCHSVLLQRRGFFSPSRLKIHNFQTQGHARLTEARRAALLLTTVPLHSHILLLPVAATRTRETEKYLLPQGLPWCWLHTLVANTFLTGWGEAAEKSN